MTDTEWIADIKNVSNKELMDKLLSCGHDHYYEDIYRAVITEIKRRVFAKDTNVPNKGEWINASKISWLPEFQCSKCGEKYTYRHNFCPNCGADMTEE